MKIVILDGSALNPGDLSYDCFRQFGDLTVYAHSDTLEEAIAHIGDAEIIIVNKVPVNQALLDACPSIRLVCVAATGYNVVDCGACSKRGIPVTNVPAYGTASVAQYTMALLLELCHQIGLHNTSVHGGDWCASKNFCYWLTDQVELAGKTLGIIGFGRIGQAVARLAVAFGMNVLIYSRRQTEEGRSLGRYVTWEELLEQADFVTLHCPQTSENLGLMGKSAFARMKTGAMLINTARGGLVDEQALAEALNTGKLAGAAVDVISQEPMLPDNPLLHAKNCIITPHMAWGAQAGRQRLVDCVVENIRGYLAGKPQNVVNQI